MEEKIFEQLRELLAVTIGHNPEEITPASQLEIDLGINLEEDFARLLAIINHEFGIELEAGHVLHELEEAQDSVEQLAKLIEEEVELG
ncbi:MAG TPA: hypothetical protein VGA89_01590 [Patescibacteria group bacterium]|jgi:hypothetical protein